MEIYAVRKDPQARAYSQRRVINSQLPDPDNALLVKELEKLIETPGGRDLFAAGNEPGAPLLQRSGRYSPLVMQPLAVLANRSSGILNGLPQVQKTGVVIKLALVFGRELPLVAANPFLQSSAFHVLLPCASIAGARRRC
jgi:hypothetical protein